MANLLYEHRNQPIWMLAHDFMNKLSVIIGNCDLAQKSVESPACLERLNAIRQAATEMVEAVKVQQRNMEKLGGAQADQQLAARTVKESW